MTKRLTAKQVAEEVERVAAGMCDHEGPYDLPSLSYVDAATNAAWLIRDNLIPRWQDEPDGDGWYWVDQATGGIKRYEVCLIRNVGTEAKSDWFNETTGLRHWGRVCPIGERPEDVT